MRILVFSTHITSSRADENWTIFLNELIADRNIHVVLCTVSSHDADRINSRLNSHHVETCSLEKELNKFDSEHSKNVVKNINVDVNLRLYLNIKREPNPDQWIVTYYNIFKNLLLGKNIDHTCLAVDDPYNSPLYLMLENVSRSLDIGTSLLKAPAFRIGVFDDLSRSSTRIQELYEEKIVTGLSPGEHKKVNEFCSAYKALLSNSKYRDRWYRVGYAGQTFFSKGMDYLKRRKHLKFDKLDVGKEYLLFLPNKQYSYRQIIISPNYVNNAQIVEELANSLPERYTLVVKDHPHVYRGAIDYRMIQVVKKNLNCKYIDPYKYLTEDIIAGAKAVVVVASSSIMEALVQLKPVLAFGERPELVNVDPPIVRKVDSVSQLSQYFAEITEASPEVMRIPIFLHAFLTSTYDRYDLSNVNWGDMHLRIKTDERKEVFRNYGSVFRNHLKEYGKSSLDS